MTNRSKVITNASLVAFFTVFAGHGWAQTGASKMDMAKSAGSSDEQFVKEASAGGMAEVKLGQLAEEKGSNDTVKKFGARMVSDHTKAGDKLKQAASQSNLAVSDKLEPTDENLYNRLSKMPGAMFDREYAKHMVEDHMHDVSEFRKEAINGQAGPVKNFASETLPTLQEHLKMAQEMEKSVSSSASTNSKVNGSY